METVEISVFPRTAIGTSASRRLRRQGTVPVTLYGPKRGTASLQIDAKEFDQKIARIEGSHLIRIKSAVPEFSDCVALVRATQSDPVSGRVLHADFYEVDMATKLSVKVPLHYIGKAIGVAHQGGILQPIRREVDVICLPSDIPEYIEVDVSALGVHDAIHISQLAAPAGVELSFESDEAVVTVLPPTVEEVKVEGEAAAAETPAVEPAAEKKEAAKGGASS